MEELNVFLLCVEHIQKKDEIASDESDQMSLKLKLTLNFGNAELEPSPEKRVISQLARNFARSEDCTWTWTWLPCEGHQENKKFRNPASIDRLPFSIGTGPVQLGSTP